MLVPPVSTWVTLWGLLVHHARAWNSTLIASDLPGDYTIEKSVQLSHLEGSGFDVITDNYSTVLMSPSYAESVRSNIKKRAADFVRSSILVKVVD
ncbi:unnamed protein product [Angiostrongylus costaricensis]|uniref:DUF1330 domain-containing protein n=1 Tax=Angiostrongylus costaricensis TaxID=334426 RepID=A0A0R3PAU1_ANGCS|nr:unnamed protein product [Angiostrongylus costaricensis]